jgi:predicted nucleic acid-binding protein
VKLFVDTWGWLVLADSKAPEHRAAAKCYSQTSTTSGNVVTSNLVLDETFTLLFRRRPFAEASRFANALLRSPFISVAEVTPALFQKAFSLRLSFRDKPDVSFTDLTSMVVAQDLKIVDILTGDKHFIQSGLGFRILP